MVKHKRGEVDSSASILYIMRCTFEATGRINAAHQKNYPSGDHSQFYLIFCRSLYRFLPRNPARLLLLLLASLHWYAMQCEAPRQPKIINYYY